MFSIYKMPDLQKCGFILTIFLLCFGSRFALADHPKPDGKKLYELYCSTCHGENGRGGVGVPLALPAFLNTASNQYLQKTIHLGRPGRIMPGFASLEDIRINAIVEYIRSWSKVPPAQYSNDPVQGNSNKGGQLYSKHCASCHGANGEGGHGTGVTYSRPRDLPIIAPALRNAGFLAAASDQMIKATLMKGRKGTPMPSFIAQGLTEKDIDDLVSHIRSFETEIKRDSKKTSNIQMKPTLVYESSYSFEETVENLKSAAIGANFKIIREQYLNTGIAEPGKEDQRKKIVYFCNFYTLNQAMAIDSRVGLFLPCRITVVQNKENVLVMSINPKLLSNFFNNSELDKLCQRMYETYLAILEETTL